MTTACMTTAAPATRNAAAAAAAPDGPRFDFYAPIHKALRGMMTDTLARVGRLDLDDAEETGSTLAQLEGLLDFCIAHIQHENEFVHTAIEARLPAGSRRTADDHVEHLASIEALRAEARALPGAAGSDRHSRALRLYRHLALFVAENFQHMHIEETVNNASLWACYSDAELFEIHERLLASLPPQEHLLVARWMVPALNPAERAGMLHGAKAGMPPEAFLGFLAHVKPHVDTRGWTKLAQALGIAGHALAMTAA